MVAAFGAAGGGGAEVIGADGAEAFAEAAAMACGMEEGCERWCEEAEEQGGRGPLPARLGAALPRLLGMSVGTR